MTRAEQEITPRSNFVMDETDRAMVRALHADPRATNKAIAGIVDISEAAVAARIRRMIAADVLRFTLQRNAVTQGYAFQAFVYATVQGRQASDVAAEIWESCSAHTVICIQGRADVLVVVNCRTMDDATQFVERHLSTIAGIRDVQVDVTLGFLKYETHLAGFGP